MGACCDNEQQPGKKEIDKLITNQTNSIPSNDKNIYGSDATKAESSPLKVTHESHPIEHNQIDSHQLPQKRNNNETKNDENEKVNNDANSEKYIVNKFILID
eukprot:239302_1